MNVDIAYLKDYPQHLPLVAQWIFNEWGHLNPGASLEKAKAKLSAHLNKDTLPITFIALENNQPVGTCSLRINDGIRQELTPWLGSLYVSPTVRGRGLGEKLIESVINKARNMGYPKLYLFAFDPTLPNWYQKLGWQGMGMDKLNGYPVSVMEKTL
ncbi:MAG: GNAT family N-acetyltransferase [Proteobacteria bacterium]|nr:GNAT family N-acetyltransferase [Pseudomonadota bacterium]